MFGDMSSSFSDLEEDVRTRLASLLEKRNDYLVQQIKLNELRIIMLLTPSPANEAAVNAFNSTVVAPIRDGMGEDIMFLMDKALNVQGLKAMLPMVLIGVLQSVNITLALTTLGIEPDVVDRFTSAIGEFIESGM